MVTQVGYSVARRSRGQVAPCAVCIVHVESGLALKPLKRFLIVLSLKTDGGGL
jgi:hypothetical protein